ncbi:MAG: hypothetical protein DRI84_07210 [Bacteroidetes bacterium]|nr:MAG: hypothetical protein DRI84_07210 [Bacteroidota bacterium]
MLKQQLKHLAIILFLTFSFIPDKGFSKSDQEKCDSLIAVQATDINERFNNYLEISKYFSRQSLKLKYLYLDSASQILDQVSDMEMVSILYSSLGNYHKYSSNYDSSLYYLRKSYSHSTKYNITSQIGRTMMSLGIYYSKVDNYDSSLFYYNKGLEFFSNVDTSKITRPKEYYLAQINNNIGSLYLNKGEYERAIEYYYDALSLFEAYGSKLEQIIIHINLGTIYLFQKEYNKAILEYEKALIILDESDNKWISRRASVFTNMGSCYKANGKLDTAMQYYSKAMEIRKEIGPQTTIAGLNDNIGNIHKAKEDYVAALSNYQTALKIREKIGSKRGLASSYGSIGLLYVKMNKNREAIPYLKQAIEISDSNSFVEISLACLEGLSIAYKNLGDYKRSLEVYISFREMNDSIHNIELESKLNLYKEKYEAEKKDRQIQKLEEEQLIAELASERQKAVVAKQQFISNSLAIVAVLLLIILFIIYRYFKMKQRADRELLLKNEQINQQKTLDLMKEQEVSTIKSYMEGQEKERSRIAGDLHDRLGSLLSTVKLHFSSLEQNIDQSEESIKSFEYALSLLDSSVEEVRSVSRNLTKGVLTQFGLFAAVESMRDAINSARKVKMNIIRSGTEARLKADVEINLFRIIQELVTNVIRHAKTDEIFVQFVGSNDRLNIIIEDHGIGFDTKNTKSKGIGLSNLKDRVELIGGEFSIDSEIGEGTTIIIDIPYETAD